MTNKTILGNDSNGAVVFTFSKSRKVSKSLKGGNKIFYVVLARARKLYELQLDKSSCSLYADCIREVIKNTKGMTEAVFKAIFAEVVADLMDRVSFNSECKHRKLSSYVVATHLAAMSSSQRKAVLENFDLLPDRVLRCKTPIFEMEDLKDLDTYNVLVDDSGTFAEIS